MARKVNTKFLIAITAVLASLIIAALVAKKVIKRGNPDEFIAESDRLVAEGKYPEAVKNFGQALALDPANPDLLVRFGDRLASLAWYDTEYVGRARAQWEKALEVDSKYIPALNRMLEFWEELAKMSPSSDVFERMRDIASKLIDADPNDTHARAAYHLAIIRRWLSGVETDRATVDEHLAKLNELMATDPANPELPTFIAMAKIFDAQAAIRSGDRARAQALIAEADALTEDAIKNQPDNAQMHFRASQILTELAMVDIDPKNPELYKTKYLPRIKSTMQVAVEKSKPQDPEYVDIQLRAATLAAQENKIEDAEKIYKQLASQRPDDPVVRLAYAKFLAGTNRRAEAIELLARPFEQPRTMTGVRSQLIRHIRLQTLLELTNLRLDAAAQAQDPAEQQKLMAQAQENIGQLFAEAGEMPESLKLRGKLQLLKNENVEAIQTLSKARQTLIIQGRKKDSDLEYMLARAYMAAQQTGAAKELLAGEKGILKDYPNFIPAKVLMAESLIREQDLEGARPYVEDLEKALPDNPAVLRMRIALLDRKKDTAEIDQHYAKLPEETRQQRIEKAQIAMHVSKMNEAVRLLSLMLQEDPKDKQASMALAQIYLNRNQKTEAIDTINSALKHAPDDKSLQLLLATAQGVDQSEIQKSVEEMIGETEDPFQRELQLAEFARRQNKTDELLAHLKKAESIKKDDTRVWQLLFDYYLGEKKYAEAAVYADKLGKANQDQANGLLYRYRLAKAKGETENALTIARELTKAMPEFSRSWSTFGEALQATGQHEEALQRYALALEKQPTNIEALKGIISAYYAVKQPSEALQYIQNGRDIYPADPEFQRYEVEHQLNYGDPELAVGPLEEALRRKSNSPEAYAAVGNAYLKVSKKKAPTEPETAASFLNKARDTFSQAMRKWPDEPIFYGYLAEIALITGKFEEGEKILQALNARPKWKDRPEPLMAMSDFYTSSGKYDLAEKALRDALDKAQPADQPTVRSQLANLLSSSQVRKFDEALTLLEPAVEGNPRLERQRIEIMLSAGRLADADEAVRAALQKRPDSIDLLNLLGIINLSARKFEQAATPFARVLEMDSDNFTALYHLGLVRLQQPQPDYEEAIKLLRNARDAHPNHPDVRVTLADAFRRRNQIEEAISELEAALQVAPAHRGVRLELLSLYSRSSPPRWADYERLVKAAQAMPEFAGDPEWYEREAQMWLRRQDKNQAVSKMQAALAMAPDHPGLNSAYLNLLGETGNYRPMFQHAENLLAKNDKAWWIYSARATALGHLGKREESLADFGTALELARGEGNDAAVENVIRTMTREVGVAEAIQYVEKQAESNPRWRLLLVVLQRSNGNDAGAITALEQLRRDFDKLTPALQVNALRLEGTIYLTTQPPQPEKAEKAYRELLQRSPDDFTALNNLACLLAENVTPPRPQDALEFSQRAYDLMNKRGTMEPLIADTHGWVLTLLDRPEGISVLENVVQRSPFLEAHYHLAEAYLKRQYAEEAHRQLVLADELLQKAQKDDQTVDPAMVAKVNDAMNRAQEMMRSQSQAQAP